MFEFIDDFFPDWFDIGILGGLSEELAQEERERRRLEDDCKEDEDLEE